MNISEPINISEDSFEIAVMKSPVPVLVDFWAPWCGPCKMIAPALDEIARESGGRFRIAKVNVDDEPALAQRFGVRGIPALLFFSGGELRHQTAGVTGKKAIADKLEELAAAKHA
jgi:thioredoxin 1